MNGWGNSTAYDVAHLALVALFTLPAVVGILLCSPFLLLMWFDDNVRRKN